MKAKEIKQQIYGEFLKYLEENEIGDHFSTDVWMSKCFDIIFNQFMDSKKGQKTMEAVLKNVSSEKLEEALKIRKEAEAKQEELKKQVEDAKPKDNVTNIKDAKKK